MPKTRGVACAEYEKYVVSNAERDAHTRSDDRSPRSDAPRTVRTRTLKPVVTLVPHEIRNGKKTE